VSALVTGVRRHALAARGHDLYETPTEAIYALLQAENLPRVIWQPSCGPGAIARVLRASGREVIATGLIDYAVPEQDTTGRDFLRERAVPERPGYHHGSAVRGGREVRRACAAAVPGGDHAAAAELAGEPTARPPARKRSARAGPGVGRPAFEPFLPTSLARTYPEHTAKVGRAATPRLDPLTSLRWRRQVHFAKLGRADD
jgi:hypothetical protein